MQAELKDGRGRVASGKPYDMREGPEGELRTWGLSGVHMGPIEEDE